MHVTCSVIKRVKGDMAADCFGNLICELSKLPPKYRFWKDVNELSSSNI